MPRLTARFLHLLLLLILSLGAGTARGAADPQEAVSPEVHSLFVLAPDGVLIHYLEARPATPAGIAAPARPAILFVPGWTMPADIWERQIDYFSSHDRVVAMDPRSQGGSTSTGEGLYPAARARDIKMVVDQLHLAPVVLVGWSLAVTEIASYVDQFGAADLAGIVLVDGFAGLDVTPDLAKQYLGFLDSLNKDRAKVTDSFVRSMFKKPQSEGYLQRIIRAALRTPTASAVTLFLSGFNTDNRPALAKFNKPTLIVATSGNFLPLAQQMQKQIAGARLELFEDAGHALFVDDANRFNTLLAEFIRGLK
jgi:non-heme chloroperoxidase